MSAGAADWASVGDSLVKLSATETGGNVKAMETAIWCYENSLAISHDPKLSANKDKAEVRLLLAKGQQAEKNRDWDIAHDIYATLYEKKPSEMLKLKVVDMLARCGESYYTYIGKAEESLRKKDFDEAIRLYEKALSCMDNEEGRQMLLLANIERQKSLDAKDVETAPLDMNIKFEVEIEGEKENKNSSSASSIQDRLRSNSSVVMAKGISVQQEGKPLTLVKADEGRDLVSHNVDHANQNKGSIG